jgi:hypothetical protein
MDISGSWWEELWEDGLIGMVEKEFMERCQTHTSYGNHICLTQSPFIPFQPLQ